MDNIVQPTASNGKVTLNVGGTRVETLQSTLMKTQYFADFFARWNNKDEIFLDMDFDLFKHILNKLRDPRYILPENPNIHSMMDYLGFTIHDQPIKTMAMDIRKKRLIRFNK